MTTDTNESNDIYGQDILLDETFQPVISDTGEQLFTSGAQTVVQQIKLRLATPIAEDNQTGLFYNNTFGSRLYLYIREENSPENRNAMIAETINTINKDNRVNPNKTFANVATNPDGSAQIRVQFEILNEESPFNLVIEPGGDLSLLIKQTND